jgi:type I restriction enzyme R subunit
MPDLNPVNLLDTDDNITNSRFVVSTYQTMMNLIDAKKSDRKLYSVGYFDLIIVDEAHRSIYKRYGEIFNYFDALMLGLTATPKNGIDKNTYKVFDLPKGVPTDCYEYKEAVEQGYLVPYEVIDTSTKFLREGIKYSELSEEEKDEYETLFYDEETGTLPETIDSHKLNKFLFNTDTVDKILENLMVNGIKVQGGNKLGKTIIFAQNQKHADFIAERFDKSYKQYNGKFARVITYKTEYAQNLIDEFSVNEKEPAIAISVDKLDTGVDVLGVVNLVFFKPVRSYTKFIQMIGRGTRLCPNLFGPNDDKKKFYIFDACQNFEYFDQNPPKGEGGSTLSLDEAIFIRKLSLAENIKDEGGKLKEYSVELKDSLNNIIKTMDRDNFIVRRYLEDVDKFSERSIWDKLGDTDLETIYGKLAKLPTTVCEDNELTKRFDLLILNMQMALYSCTLDKFEKYKTKLKVIANLLEGKASIPQVKKHIELICDIQTEEYWDGITILELEEIRRKLRNLVDVLDYEKQEIVYTDFIDELTLKEPSSNDKNTPEADIDRAQYEKKVKAFLKEHENEIAINKLKFNKPLTKLDFQQLVEILKENADIVGTKDKFKTLVGDLGLGEFIRKVIGLESSEIEQVFAQYLDKNTFNVNQIRFIEQIIAYLKINGTMLNLGSLFESPFIDMNSDSIYGVFSSNDVDNIVNLIRKINENANLRKFM